jgi:hypothetical protein
LLLPFFIFIVSSGLIFSNWIIENSIIGPNSNPLAYIPKYLTALLGLTSERPAKVIDDIIYNYVDSDVYFWPPNYTGINILKIFNLVDPDQIVKNFDSVIQPKLKIYGTVPLYSLLPNIYHSYQNQPIILLLIIILLITSFKSLIFLFVQLGLFLTGIILFYYSYRKIRKSYYNYKALLQ